MKGSDDNGNYWNHLKQWKNLHSMPLEQFLLVQKLKARSLIRSHESSTLTIYLEYKSFYKKEFKLQKYVEIQAKKIISTLSRPDSCEINFDEKRRAATSINCSFITSITAVSL